MSTFYFKKLLQKSGWKNDVLVSVDSDGKITSIIENSPAMADTVIHGFALPGFQNAHSHAFQYAMAGLAEIHDINHSSDDFWSWRDAMYKLALSVSPEQMESIATMLYSEMVRQGYTNVAEFHYVHHDKDGNAYSNLSEMGERMISAAKKTGINITLVPIFYQMGGFGKAPSEGQRRFISPQIEDYLRLLEASNKSCEFYKGANIGIGIHSMRGVKPTDIAKIAADGPQDFPFHIHISEQLKEIKDSFNYLGKRPVEWLLDNVQVSDRFHLVHATHLTKEETLGIANNNANVVICPTTEGNLGDGLFPLIDYQKAGGKWSIGTDSHVGINPLEELRLLDYGQRLIAHKRNIYTTTTQGDSGAFAIDMATTTGRKAMNNFSTEYFSIGDQLNAAIIKDDSPLLALTQDKNLTSSILYTSDATQHYGTVVNGLLLAKDGVHIQHEAIKSDFMKTMNELKNR